MTEHITAGDLEREGTRRSVHGHVWKCTKLGSLRENNSSHFSVYSSCFVPFSGKGETFHLWVKLSAKIDVWLVTHFWILLLLPSLTSAWQRCSVYHWPLLQSSLSTPLGVEELARGHRPAPLGELVLTDRSQRLQQVQTLLCILAEHPPPSKFLSFVLQDKNVTVKLKVFNLTGCR